MINPPGSVGVQRPNEPEAEGHHDHPYHRDEQVRIGRVVHATMSYGCASARIVGHPNTTPDEERGEVYLAIDRPPGKERSDEWLTYRMWRPVGPSDRSPYLSTWHWPRACPFGV